VQNLFNADIWQSEGGLLLLRDCNRYIVVGYVNTC